MILGAGFAVAVAFYANSLVDNATHSGFLVLAAVFGAYMAMNIGANDVANNVGPAVGSGALTIGGAIIIASIFEASGALIAGGDVVGTIKKGIIDPAAFGGDPMIFVYAMSAALLLQHCGLILLPGLKHRYLQHTLLSVVYLVVVLLQVVLLLFPGGLWERSLLHGSSLLCWAE